MEVALEMARLEALPVAIANALLNLGSGSGKLMQLPQADRWLAEATAPVEEREFDATVRYGCVWLALCDLHRGRWAEAVERADMAASRLSLRAALALADGDVPAQLRGLWHCSSTSAPGRRPMPWRGSCALQACGESPAMPACPRRGTRTD